jgi:hypothetical protein
VWPGRVEILQACSGLGDMAQWNGDCACVDIQHGRLEGIARQSRDHAGPMEWISVQACAGLGGMAQQNLDHECVDHRCGRPWGHGPAEWRSCRPV